MKGAQAAQALTSYMGQTGIASAPSYSDVEIGGGRITGTETSIEHPNGTSFAMYHTDQYMAPEGNYRNRDSSGSDHMVSPVCCRHSRTNPVYDRKRADRLP